MVESIAKVRQIRITPQKARRVVDLIRGKQAVEALAILRFSPQAASPNAAMSAAVRVKIRFMTGGLLVVDRPTAR